MAVDEFTKLYKFMAGRFDKLDKSLESKASIDDVSRILGAIDSSAKRLEISEQERLVMGHQLDKLDRWVHELADKVGYQLSS